jgi:uncharacterized protein (TIGR02996 family)
VSRPEVLGLLRDIKQRPEEPGLRLILADWLEDHGDAADRARAEVIRIQLRGGPDPRPLIAAHQAAWLGPIRPSWGAEARFRDGLVSFRLTSGDLISTSLRAVADSEAWAWVEEVRVNERAPRRLALNPLLASLNAFSCTDMGRYEGDPIAEDLSRAEWLRTVRRLDLSGLHFGYAAAEQLFGSPHLAALAQLTLSRSEVTARKLGLISRLRLKQLTIGHSRIGDGEAAAIAHDADFASLEELNLTDNEIGDGGARALAESPYLGRLQLLTLFGNRIGAEGVRRLRERFGARVLIAGG